jgi:N-acetylneuraminic acid mutarotase
MMRRMLPVGVLAILTVFLAVPAAATPTQEVDRGWKSRPSLGLARVGLDVATVNGQILAIGGFNGDLANPVTYDTVEARAVGGDGRWQKLAPMPTARSNHAAAALGGFVYVTGGFGASDETLDVVERFDPRTGSWQSSPKLPVPVGAAGAAALGGKLYVAGGLLARPSGDEVSAAVFAFDPARRTWSVVAPMPTPRWRLRLVAAGGFLYAIGGQGVDGRTLSTVERYDPRTNTWSAVRSMREGRAVPGVTALSDGLRLLVVVVGGVVFEPSTHLLRTTEVYDTLTDTWHTVDALLPHARGSLGCALESDGTVLAIGGASDITSPPSATADVDALARHL